MADNMPFEYISTMVVSISATVYDARRGNAEHLHPHERFGAYIALVWLELGVYGNMC